jgi:hypothetical protein
MNLKKLFFKKNVKKIIKEEEHLLSFVAFNNVIKLLKDEFSFQKDFLSEMRMKQRKSEHIKQLKKGFFGSAVIVGDKYKVKTISLKLEDMLNIFPLQSIKLASVKTGGFLEFHTHTSPNDIRETIHPYDAIIDGEYFGIKQISYWEFDREEMKEFQKQELIKESEKEEIGFDLIHELETLSKNLLTVMDEQEIKMYLVKYQDTFENLVASLNDSFVSGTPLSEKSKNTLSELLKEFHTTISSRIIELEKAKQDFLKDVEESRQKNYKEIIDFEKEFQLNNLL